MTKFDKQYQDLIKHIYTTGFEYIDPNRKNVKRKEIFCANFLHSSEDGYPILNLRRVPFKNAVSELLLFLKGKNDIRDFWKEGIKFWDQDVLNFHQIESFDLALEHQFSMGKIYPYQYRKLNKIDQIATVFDNFKKNPLRTDLVVNAWNPNDLNDMCLKPCHTGFQIISDGEIFNIVFNMRSSDVVLGFTLNFQYYYLMGLILEKWTGLKLAYVVANLNKVHIYDNQFEMVESMLQVNDTFLPSYVEIEDFDITLNANDMIESLDKSMFTLHNYYPNENIKPVKMLAYEKDI